MKKKLIYLGFLIVFIFLTGGIKYHLVTNYLFNRQSWQYEFHSYEQKIKVFGFYCYRNYDKDLNLTGKTVFGWGLDPSLILFSISKETKYHRF